MHNETQSDVSGSNFLAITNLENLHLTTFYKNYHDCFISAKWRAVQLSLTVILIFLTIFYDHFLILIDYRESLQVIFVY